MFIRSQSIFISLTMAMFTQRKMFSSSLESSATRVEDTGTTSARAPAYRAEATSRHVGVKPPTIFGIVLVLWVLFPGSSRSGLKARWKSTPAFRPFFSSSGLSTSSVVPG
jgi:hypothetical protein